jgi:indole-3-glycerol phosphate synthase
MILDEIVLHKKKEVEKDKKRYPLDELKSRIKNSPHIRDIKPALTSPLPPIRIIAEVKKASPSKGIIRKDFDPVEIAKTYEDNKAAAISVLTEGNFFHGSLDFLKRIREVTSIPLLCKDFIFDTYQIYQARLFGADAFLLIAAILEDRSLDDLLKTGKALGMEAIVEVHNMEELKRVLQTDAEIIGINNRNLKTFKTDISTTTHLAKEIPKEKIVVSESGIHTCEHISRLKESGINKFLIGESLMREKNIGEKLTELLSAR